MAKVKNKRNAGLADKVHKKKKADAVKKTLNPFEVHINREKIKVLGKKSKHDRGLPGVSRAKAIQKRKETLGTEMKIMNKTNSFIDRRIGEKNNQLSAEDRMVVRFTAERAKQHDKKSIYNLADDEILTHRGQTLEQIEKFDDPRSSDDEDEVKRFGGLNDDFVSEGHFGGGVLSKSDAKDGAKSHKDLIEQLIAESKKRKAEKQKEKEQTLDLTEKLDSEWKDLQPVVFKRQKEESLIDKLLSKAEKGQDYDIMMRELRFEKRGTPSDGLKSKEKQDEEERKKLAELERERRLRMLSEEEIATPRSIPSNKHRSADDLDDNFELEDTKEFMLAYDKDGKPLVPEHILKDYSVPNARKKFEDGISDSSEDEGSETGDESDDEAENDENEIAIENTNNSNENDNSDNDSTDDDNIKTTNESNENNEIDNSDDTDEDDNKTDVKINGKDSDSESDDNLNVEEKKKMKDSESFNRKKSESSEGSTSENEEISISDNRKKEKLDNSGILESKIETSSDEESDDEILEDEKKSFRVKRENQSSAVKLNDLQIDKETYDSDVEMEDSTKIGSFFDIKSQEGYNLKELLTGKSPSQQSAALQKIIKSYDPSLNESNKERLSRLFAHLLQYTHDLFSNITEETDVIKAFLIFDKIVPYFYDLIHINKVSTKKFLVELLKEKHDNFMRNPKKVPDLNTLIFFKLVSILYPTSDFRHPVTTPSLIFMSQILFLSRFRDAYSVSRGLFIVSLLLEYTVLSKRLVPSALNFLRGIFYLCANTSVLNPVQVVPPFRLHRDVKILNLERDCSKMTFEDKMAAKDLVIDDIDDTFRIRCFITSVLMLKEFFDNYNDLEALEALFEPHLQVLGRVDLDLYPVKVAEKVTKIIQYIKQTLEVKTYTQMAREKVRPKALRLYEPDVQEVFTGSKSSKLSRADAERARLQNKYKKEMKGAKREIRRDNAYIASVKIRQKIQSDNIRKEKVKQIYRDASIQQGELNKLKRAK